MMARLVIGVATVCAVVASMGFGPLDPPAGPISGTGRTLTEIYNAASTGGGGDTRTAITTLPMTISTPGSYYLAVSPAAYSAGVGITIASHYVTLDLNGQTLTGGGSGTPGTNHAINVTVSVGVTRRNGIVIKNGMIRDWNGSGIEASNADGVQITDVQVQTCGVAGVRAGESAEVTRVISRSNKANGIELGASAVVRSCTAVNNGAHIANPTTGSGILVGDGSVVEGCVANQNAAGIVAALRTTITNCTASSNDVNGINVGSDCYVHRNTAGFNGTLVTVGAGIIATGTDNRIEQNNTTKNDYNIYLGAAGNLMIGNSASGANQGQPNEYFAVAGNHVGLIVINPGLNFSSTSVGSNYVFN